MDTYTFHKLTYDDYHLGYLTLLEQLTVVNSENITFDDFKEQLDMINLSGNIHIFTIMDNNGLVGCGTIVIEKKFIHNLSSVGHIEDIVIDKEYRNKGIGKLIINYLTEFARNNGCYKVILDCSKECIDFYNKCGYEQKNIQMALYL